MMRLKTKRDLPFATRGGLLFTIPAGSEVEPAKGQPGMYWVKPEVFHKDSMEHHDATYYGVTVAAEDVEEFDLDAEPTA